MLFSLLVSPFGSSPAKADRTKKLSVERLESREVLSAGGLVDVGSQPSGALDGKIVYVNAGHGITWNGSSWGYQRPLLLDMVEDLGNQDQMTYFADHLWRSGATVVPMRPIGNQVNEVILDNDDAGVSFEGSWSNSSSSVYFGDAGDVPFRFAQTSATETATAVYRPTLPEDGFYPVYTWAPAGTNRANDQLYRVHHSGGATEVTIDHSRVGNGVIYLGTFHFEAGDAGFVEISNRSNDPGKVVVADMIRFGNGMGDVTPGGVVSGQPREDEAGLYWIQWHAENAQGIPSSEYGTSTVSSPPRYSEFMNQANVGAFSDRVFVSYHSNAITGDPATATARGVIGLHNTSTGGATPNQRDLALELASEINSDLVAQNGVFEHNWQSRSNLLFDASFNYGEINNSSINNEFDATIIETGFHDNTLDAQMLRDPRVRDALAKATTQGLVDYFDSLDTTTPNIDAPPPVTGLRAESTGSGEVTLTWSPDLPSSFGGGIADGYVVYASTNGFGFDGGTVVAGAGTTSATITGLDPNETYYFRVAASNAGGESAGSEVAAAKANGSSENVLIVNGFDRLDRNLVPTEPFTNGLPVDRVRPRQANSFDYAIQVAEAIEDAGATVAVSTASNEMIAAGDVSLDDYDAVFWILGEESTENDTFDLAEQAAVIDYLGQGGKLFASGAEIGWDLDQQNNGRAFYNSTLKADYIADDAGTYQAAGVAGSIFEGLTIDFDNGENFYNVDFPDVIAPLGGATTALDYAGSAAGAAIQFDGGDDQLVMLGFPFETITSVNRRADVMTRVLDFFGFATSPPMTVSLILDNDDGPGTYTETGSWNTSGLPGFEGSTQRTVAIGQPATATWQTNLPTGGEVEVFVRYSSTVLSASGAVYNAQAVGGLIGATVNQQQNGDSWVSIGTLEAEAGPLSVTLDAQNSTSFGPAIVYADAVRLDLRASAPAIAGDYDGSGVVEQADYDVWRASFGSTVPAGFGADGNGDGVVNAADYGVWRDAIAAPAAVAGFQPTLLAVSAPEPATASVQPIALLSAPVPQSEEQANSFSTTTVSSSTAVVDAEALLLLAISSPEDHLDLTSPSDAFQDADGEHEQAADDPSDEPIASTL